MIRIGGIFIGLGLLLSAPALAEKPVDTVLWAGHQVVFGEAEVPIIGTVKTRAESTFLAKVERYGNTLILIQKPCSFDFQETMGVKIRLPKTAITNLPPAKIQFEFNGNRGEATQWVVAWDTQDIDQDGKPGMTVFVDAALCGGELQIASASISTAMASLSKDGLRGSVRVRVIQEILNTSGVCLSLFSSDIDEIQAGSFAYQKVPPQSTCESLQRNGWPANAELKMNDSKEKTGSQ